MATIYTGQSIAVTQTHKDLSEVIDCIIYCSEVCPQLFAVWVLWQEAYTDGKLPVDNTVVDGWRAIRNFMAVTKTVRLHRKEPSFKRLWKQQVLNLLIYKNWLPVGFLAMDWDTVCLANGEPIFLKSMSKFFKNTLEL